MRETFSRHHCPLPWRADLDFGFLHRLDVPSSGLILCGTTFSGLLALRWQLDTYQVERQYAVCGHGRAPAALAVVTANIATYAVASKKSSVSDLHGKPAKTHFKVLAHLAGRRGRDTVGGDVTWDGGSGSVFAIRIRTSRRHEIRAHLCLLGFPSVADCKYTARSISVNPSALSTPTVLTTTASGQHPWPVSI